MSMIDTWLVAYYDLGDDPGLAERAEEVGEAPGDDDDEANLQDDQRQRVVQRALPLERAVRRHAARHISPARNFG
jgi:hypothetical protein